MDPAAQAAPPAVERPDTDDYDLLTYGEAGARLTEVLAGERARLVAGEQDPAADPAELDRVRERVALLETNAERYRRQAMTAEAFAERFGFRPPAASGDPNQPRWE